jgi:hypothetical protein
VAIRCSLSAEASLATSSNVRARWIAVAPYNKQLQRTVIPQHVRAASASFDYALAPRFARQRAVVELQR